VGLPAFVSKAQSLEATYLLAPATAASALTNLGTAGGSAELKNGASLVEPGLIDGGALAELDGTNDLVLTAYSPFVIGSSRTFCGLAKRDASASFDTLFGGKAESLAPLLRIGSGNQTLEWWPNDTNLTSWTSAWPGNAVTVFWAMTWNDSTKQAELYINGVSVGAKANTGSFPASPGVLQVGARKASTDPWDGKQFPFAVFGKVLTAGQITELNVSITAEEKAGGLPLAALSSRNRIVNP